MLHFCFKTRAYFGAQSHHENLNEDRLYNQWRRCSPMTLDSDNIRFTRIFAGVPWKGGVKQQWGNRKRVFPGFRTLRIRHLRKWGQHYFIGLVLFSPLSPFRRLQNTWPWMTSNSLNGHFTYMFITTNCHWLIICCLFSVVCLLHVMWPADKCGKRSIANSDPQSSRIFGIRGKSADLPLTLYRRNLNK